MMKNILNPQQEVFWLQPKEHLQKPLMQSLETDVVIVGGGLAGISAAQAFHERGAQVVLLEHFHCGAGASGKSSGFVNPNAELGLTHFVHVYGPTRAKELWDFIISGVNYIQQNIITHDIACDYTPRDVLIVANSRGGFKELQQEHTSFNNLGYASTLYAKQEIPNYINSSAFYGGLRSGNAFGINTFSYIQAMKELLIKQGVIIHEETPVLTINPDGVQTPDAYVKARHIIICTDRFMPLLHALRKQIFQVQTFILSTSPLERSMIKKIFPGEQFLAWDTDLIYQYYRLTGDNRLLVGGSTMWQSFSYSQTYNAHSVYRKLTHYITKKFPELNVTIEYMWPGLIGISKDLQPLAGRDADHANIYYIGAVTGLSWAAALGKYAAEHILEGRSDFDNVFSPYRKFPLSDWVQTLVGKKVAFSLSNLISLKR